MNGVVTLAAHQLLAQTAAKYPAVVLGEELSGPAKRALLDEQTPLGTRTLDAETKLMLLNAAADDIEETADRLGLVNLVAELQDACFALLLPAEYGRLARSLKQTLADDARRLGELTTSLQQLVQQQGLVCALQSRLKGLYSLYRKMVRKGRGLEGIRDRAGIRIIVGSIDDCYRALGLVHTNYAYIPDTFHDYIGAPKPNGYRSLHTCVSAADHLTAEIQIRTLQMHLEAEYGSAAHWRYKRSAISLASPAWPRSTD